MAYTIHKVDGQGIGAMIDAGQTRGQVSRALVAHGLCNESEFSMPLPRFGKAVIISRPLFDVRGSFAVCHK